MATYLLTAQSVDRPGIVAAVSGAVAEHKWSIEDASMTRLAGRFAMLLALEVPDDVTVEMITDRLQARLEVMNVRFTLESVTDGPTPLPERPGSTWSITVYGSDRPGIVAGISAKLAELRVNIDNLATRATESPAGMAYSMLIDATVPDDLDPDKFVADLGRAGELLGVTCHASKIDVDIL